MKARNIPNLISILRILLVAPTVYYLLREDFRTALVLFFIAGISDGVDGILARHFQWQTRLGAILDPVGDKLLLVSCFLVMGWLGHLPLLLVVLVMLRDVVIVSGAVLYHFLIAEVPIQPLMISKINTALQIALVVLQIFAFSGWILSNLVTPLIIDILIWLVYASTLASGTGYVWLWGRRAIAASRREAGA